MTGMNTFAELLIEVILVILIADNAHRAQCIQEVIHLFAVQ
jgi:hypothetical protein